MKKKNRFWDTIDFKLVSVLALILAFVAFALLLFLADAHQDQIKALQADVAALEEALFAETTSSSVMEKIWGNVIPAHKVYYTWNVQREYIPMSDFNRYCYGRADMGSVIQAILDHL